ncbi:MAG: amidohydrolase family protein [Actinomycetota bacterium]
MTVVDIHSHLFPRSYIELLRRRNTPPRVVGERGDERLVTFPEETGNTGRPITEAFWDVGVKLAFMEQEGIDQTLVTLGNPWLDPFPDGLDVAWSLNEEFAALATSTGGRILGAGVLPLDLEDALRVAEEVATAEGLFGLVAGPRICDRTLDDAALDPLWTSLERLELPLLIHPKGERALHDLGGYGGALPVGIGFPFETTVAVARLTLAGVFERHPGLRLVASHGGGTLPYLAGRLDMVWRTNEHLHARLQSPPSESLQRLHVDSLVYAPRAIRAATDLVGTGRMMFGTDHPWSSSSRDAVDAALEGEQLHAVLGGTATVVWGLPSPKLRSPH